MRLYNFLKRFFEPSKKKTKQYMTGNLIKIQDGSQTKKIKFHSYLKIVYIFKQKKEQKKVEPNISEYIPVSNS